MEKFSFSRIAGTRSSQSELSTRLVSLFIFLFLPILMFFVAGCPETDEEAPPPLEFTDEEPQCEENEDCDDRDPCTSAICIEGRCVRSRTETSPTVLARIQTPAPAEDVFLESSRWLHVAVGKAGIQTYDLNPLPDKPPPLARQRGTIAPATGVSFFRNHVFALVGDEGIEAFHRDEDAAKSLYRTVQPARSVIRVDDLVVASVGSRGLEIIDYADISSPSRLSRADTHGRAERVLRYSSALHVADGLAGVAFVNFRDRSEPSLLRDRRKTTEGRVMAISIRPPLTFLAELGAGVGVIDADQPDLDRLALIQVGGNAMDIDTLSIHTALVAAAEGGVIVIDYLNPSAPSIVSRLPLAGPALRMSRQDERVAVAMGEQGVAIIDLGCTIPDSD